MARTAQLQQFRILRGGDLQDLGWREPFAEPGELPSLVLGRRIEQEIAAKGELHAEFLRPEIEIRRRVRDLLELPCTIGVGKFEIALEEGLWIEPDALLRHQFQGFVAREISVFNGLHARLS